MENIFELDNGIRIIHKEITSSKVIHCGFVLDVGSRDEKEDQVGLAHFWEHMVFKGTKKRKAFHVINRLESVGGELNAYTSKEKIYFYASALSLHFEKSMELLSDITFNSVFPEREIEKEKRVIKEEMSMYLDTPEDAIVDEFDDLVFSGHSLGNNILGTEESISKFTKADFDKFLEQNLNTERIIFSSVGNVPFEKVKKMAIKYFSDIPAYNAQRKRDAVSKYVPKNIEKIYPINQTHSIIGGRSYSMHHKNRVPFFMLTNILGGPGMNSRLNLSLREKRGYVYSVEASAHAYSDTGLFAVYFGTESRYAKKSTELVLKEIKKLQEQRLGVLQLHNAKEQIMGQLAMAEESNSGLMQVMGKSMLDLGKVDTVNQIFDKIKAVSAEQLIEVANEVLEPNLLSYLTYKPE